MLQMRGWLLTATLFGAARTDGGDGTTTIISTASSAPPPPFGDAGGKGNGDDATESTGEQKECVCKDSWEYKGATYSGCTTTPGADSDIPWCYTTSECAGAVAVEAQSQPQSQSQSSAGSPLYYFECTAAVAVAAESNSSTEGTELEAAESDLAFDDVVRRIEELAWLRASGTISTEDFSAMKGVLLEGFDAEAVALGKRVACCLLPVACCLLRGCIWVVVTVTAPLDVAVAVRVAVAVELPVPALPILEGFCTACPFSLTPPLLPTLSPPSAAAAAQLPLPLPATPPRAQTRYLVSQRAPQPFSHEAAAVVMMMTGRAAAGGGARRGRGESESNQYNR